MLQQDRAPKIVNKRSKVAFRVLIIGGTGQVGAAVVRALAAEPSCAEVVMVNRKAIPLTANHRLRQVIWIPQPRSFQQK